MRRVHGIARDRLLNLRELRLGIADEEIANVRAVLEFRLQNLDRDAKQAALHLHKASIEGSAAIHRREETESAFPPDVRRLDRRAILQNRQQREDGAIREIGVLEEAARLAHDLAKPIFNSLKIGIDPRAAGRLKGAEQTIGMRNLVGQ
ncbi:MAG: hypothetical protein ACR2KT_09255 [Methylocella sp.]